MRLIANDEEIPFLVDLNWLMLPVARRELGLQRRDVMLDYEKHDAPGDAEAHDAARKMNITTGQFYRLRRQWQQERSIFSLMPYGRPGAARAPKLSKPVSEAVTSLVNDAIGKGGLRSPGEILRRISDRWRLDEPIPSHMTLRKNISRALLNAENADGNPDVNRLHDADDPFAAPSAYGEVIAIDHAATNIFVSQEIGPVQAMVVFAIDVYTSQICGFHIFTGEPAPTFVLEALRNTAATSREQVPADAWNLHPHIYIACSRDRSWPNFLATLCESDITVSLRTPQDAPHGDVIHRLIGEKIGRIALPRIGGRLGRSVFDPAKYPLMTLSELTALFVEGVKEFNEKRSFAGVEYRPLSFGRLI